MEPNDDRLAAYIEQVRRVRHDVNGPLTVALGHVQLLLEESSVDGDVRRSLEVVEGELRRLIAALRGLDSVQPPPVQPGESGSADA